MHELAIQVMECRLARDQALDRTRGAFSHVVAYVYDNARGASREVKSWASSMVGTVSVQNPTGVGQLEDRGGLGYEEVPVIPVRAHSSGREGPRTTGPHCRR